ncbi:MAG: DUF551 domain-containing protein [Aggregatibacter sp.]|uniref:DUF551 domain-containing protein n=1 Tax=Aggregatibacter sp. TaxID=1872413 RepID=UPI003623AAF0
MKKYFAYDALEREFTTHDTLEEAKSQAQDYVDHTFDIGADNGFGDDLEDGIKETCFGVALGGFDLPTRSLTKEEEDIYGDQYTYMVENPVLVEYPQNNGWIKCSERLPERAERVLVLDDDMSCYFAALKFEGNRKYWELECYDQNIGYGVNVSFDEILYWRPELDLPQD